MILPSEERPLEFRRIKTCPEELDPLLAWRDALRLELAAAEATTIAREGRPLAWPQDLPPALQPQALEEALAAWQPPADLAVQELDCSEYPCLLLVSQAGFAPPSAAVAEGLVLPRGNVVPVRVEPLEDGRPATVFALQEEGAGLDSRHARVARRAEELGRP